MDIREAFIVDYGCGNFSSLRSWLRHLNLPAWLISSDKDFNLISNESIVILPGVGHFGHAMSYIESNNYLRNLHALHGTVPIIGICLGAQIMFSASQEAPDSPGLGWLSGCCSHLPIQSNPRLGWYNSQIQPDNSSQLSGFDCLNGSFYYNHCYYMPSLDPNICLLQAESNSILSSFITQKLLFGCQFHPERSQLKGRLYLSSVVSYLSKL